ncbi:hypothetical protein [Pseudomonas fluorescens]|uniref:SH3b domain-containing protein n=1 Tax=Pseudomonas fluorescens TaxID=294 RepID=A0A5E6Y1B7_PSEFL|nr:hypothetical protein [Pseudomonas fluorescens]VVN45851.1 hypothetical protein PS655_05813 [Pseudomonas fluorescens]
MKYGACFFLLALFMPALVSGQENYLAREVSEGGGDSGFLWSGDYLKNSDLCTSPSSGGSCSNQFSDRLKIEPAHQGYLVELYSTQADQHVCSFSVSMNLVNGMLVYKTKFGDVFIRKKGRSLEISSGGIDPTALGLGVCGAHADIDGLAFPLTSRVSEESPKERTLSRVVDFQYDDPVAGRYSTLTILSGGKVVRILRGGTHNGGTFERQDPPNLSPDGNFVLLSQIESGEVEVSNNTFVPHEVAYCDLVYVHSGCIVARETGEFCGGAFSRDGRWDNSLYPDFNLTAAIPRVSTYAEGKMEITDSPGSSLENLLVCDPPRDVNRKTYSDMLQLLERDGDTSNVAKLKTVMNTASIRSAEEGSSPATKANDVKVKSVISEKAYLYRSPLLSDKTASYLIRGDVVSVLSNTNNSFVKFRYTQKNGAVIEKWIRCEDVDSCGPK